MASVLSGSVWVLYLLCRSRRHRWASSRQSCHRSTPGSSSYRRCHFCMDSHSEFPAVINNMKRQTCGERGVVGKQDPVFSPWSQECSGIGLWRCHTPLRSHKDTAPGNRGRRNRGGRSRYRRVPPTRVGMCILLSLGGSWRVKKQNRRIWGKLLLKCKQTVRKCSTCQKYLYLEKFVLVISACAALSSTLLCM